MNLGDILKSFHDSFLQLTSQVNFVSPTEVQEQLTSILSVLTKEASTQDDVYYLRMTALWLIDLASKHARKGSRINDVPQSVCQMYDKTYDAVLKTKHIVDGIPVHMASLDDIDAAEEASRVSLADAIEQFKQEQKAKEATSGGSQNIIILE